MAETTSQTIITTKEQITKVVAEWWERYTNNLEDFTVYNADEADAEASAGYFIKFLHEVK